MGSPFEFDGIDWEGRGYFGCPQPPSADRFPVDGARDPWLTWARLLEAAKRGEFSRLPTLIDLYWQTKDHVFRHLCSILLGDAGPTACLSRIEGYLKNPDKHIYSDNALNFCRILAARGRLADVPLLLSAFLQRANVRDMDMVCLYISRLLEPETGSLSDPSEFPSLEEYAASVMRHYDKLAERFKTLDVFVYGGERFGVIRLAEKILVELHEPWFSTDLRARFESSTGIDCSGFYQAGVLQPLTAAAIVEQFLDSPESAHYEDGVRYFFKHRLPG